MGVCVCPDFRLGGHLGHRWLSGLLNLAWRSVHPIARCGDACLSFCQLSLVSDVGQFNSICFESFQILLIFLNINLGHRDDILTTGGFVCVMKAVLRELLLRDFCHNDSERRETKQTSLWRAPFPFFFFGVCFHIMYEILFLSQSYSLPLYLPPRAPPKQFCAGSCARAALLDAWALCAA